LETLLKSDADSKTLVSLMHINNEIGNILDLKAVGGISAKPMRRISIAIPYNLLVIMK